MHRFGFAGQRGHSQRLGNRQVKALVTKTEPDTRAVFLIEVAQHVAGAQKNRFGHSGGKLGSEIQGKRPRIEQTVLNLYREPTPELFIVRQQGDEVVGYREARSCRQRIGLVGVEHLIAGTETAWRARPFVSNSNCFVVPPMKFALESCQVMEACIEGGMPVLLLSAGQAGATAPASIAGAIVQAVAECLAGLVYVNAIRPGHPAIFGTWPFVSDLRTGAMSGGSGEQALLTAGCAQMHRYYDLPGGAAAGIADSKLPDMQAGWEQMCSNVLAGASGLNMVYEAAGMHASLLGFCHESLILGDDLIGQALRCVRGIEVTEDALSLEVIRATCLDGPGHYLGSEQTLSLMQTDYVYPSLGDRSSPKEWAERGQPDLIAAATARKTALLARPSAARFDPMTDRAIRAAFPIHLPA